MDISILFIVLALILIYIVFVYNSLIRAREAVRNDAKQIDIQLDRRYKVFESLISAVKKYMDYEQTVLKDVVALRAQAKSANDSGDQANRMSAENAISKIASGIQVMFEAYPDLKANENVLKLQEEIAHTENKLAFAKQAYNDGAERFNSMIQQFPVNLIVNAFGEAFKSFQYWQLSEEDAKSKEEYIARL